MRERERERERARTRARGEASDGEIVPLIVISPSRSTAREEDPRSRSTLREIAPSIAISDRNRAVDRDLRSRSPVVVDDFFLGCGLCFSGFVFSFFFSKHQKIFSGKYFEMQPNTEKYFPFSEINISGKYVFSGKRFTATKHSLRPKLPIKISNRKNDSRNKKRQERMGKKKSFLLSPIYVDS